MYELIVLRALRYFGLTNMREIERMTMNEYHIRLLAYQLKRLDEQHAIHLQAWANNQITATKVKGKRTEPYFKEFKKFFDFEKLEKELLNYEDVQKDEKLNNLLIKANAKN